MLRVLLSQIILSLMLLNSISSAQQKYKIWRGLTGKEMEYQLVSKEQLDENINEIFYLPPDESGLRKPGIILQNSIIGKKIVSKDKVINYNMKTMIKDNLNTRRFFISDNLEYFGREVVINPPTTDKRGLSLVEFFSKNGDKLFEKKIENSYEYSVWYFKITNDGHFLAFNEMDGIIKIYNNNGDLISEKNILLETDFNRMLHFKSNFSENGKYIVLNVVGLDTNENRYITTILFDQDLNVLFKKRLDYENTGGIGVSNDGNIIIICYAIFYPEEKIKSYIFNRINNNTTIFDNLLINDIYFFNNLILLSDRIQRIILYDVNNEKTIFEENFLGRILAYDYAPDKELLFVLAGLQQGHRRGHTEGWYSNARVIVLNLNKVPAYELNLGSIHYQSRTRSFISCKNDASEFIFKIGDHIYTYKALQ